MYSVIANSFANAYFDLLILSTILLIFIAVTFRDAEYIDSIII